jgi:1-acyl-sn-glycerol-3-phosphate acyltransferase
MLDRHAPRCGPVAHWIGRVWVKAFGWKVEGEPPPIAKCVFIAAPHTSNWDMPHMLGVAWALGLKVAWMGKKQIFRWPFSGFFQWLGGIPIDRSAQGNMVKRVAELFDRSEGLYLVVPVEGTRSRTEYWKSGFYHIAREAQVPIICSYLDYTRRVTGIGLVLEPTGDLSADMDELRKFYASYEGRFPEMQGPIRLREEDLLEEDRPAAKAGGAPASVAQ